LNHFPRVERTASKERVKGVDHAATLEGGGASTISQRSSRGCALDRTKV
jgi:hypothetical protein